MESFSSDDSVVRSTITDCKSALDDLVGNLRALLTKWIEYREILDSNSSRSRYQSSVIHDGRRGRLRFEIAKEQLEYLASISFTWKEIAALLGVSRMTLYR